MLIKNVILTHWAVSEDKKIIVNPTISKYIQNYHLIQLRFIYSRYKNKFKGVVLNCSQDMVCPISVVAFLATITKLPNPILVLTSNLNLKYWRYLLSLIPQANLQLSGSSKSRLPTKGNNLVVVLGTSKDSFSEYDRFSIVVIDDSESIINARTKRGDFNICITYKNFYRNPNDKLLWTILNWSNVYFVGSFVVFSRKFNELLDSRIEPYSSIYLRTTWEFCDTFKKINAKDLEGDIKHIDTSDSDSDDLKNDKKRKKSKLTPKIVKQSPKKRVKIVKNQHGQTNFDHVFEETLLHNTLTPPTEITNSFIKNKMSKITHSADSLHFNHSSPTIKEIQSSNGDDEDLNNSIIGKIFDSPVKVYAEKTEILDLFDSESFGFEYSDIWSGIFGNYSDTRNYESSILDRIIDAKLNLGGKSSFTCDSGDSDGESILSRLFPK